EGRAGRDESARGPPVGPPGSISQAPISSPPRGGRVGYDPPRKERGGATTERGLVWGGNPGGGLCGAVGREGTQLTGGTSCLLEGSVPVRVLSLRAYWRRWL